MKNVLLYSSGLDSELYRILEKPDALLFFRSGARYEKHEAAQIERLKDSGIIKQEVITDKTLNFAELEDQKSCVVPMRNIMYLIRAFELTNEVYIGVTHYDLHIDKQQDVLNALMGFVQNYYYGRDIPETWEGYHPTILTPYREFTKGELLSLAIEKGEDVSHIPTLRTCYSATSVKGCGKCKSCIQKAIALAVNDMFEPELFDEDPRLFVDQWTSEYLEYAKNTIDPDVYKAELEKLINAKNT